MIKNELMKNGSGYIDPTAGKALTAIQNEESRTGEIWTIETKGDDKQMLIVADNTAFVTGLILNESSKDQRDIKVLSKSYMYANPAMLTYAFNDRLVGFVRQISDSELDYILRAIAALIGINSDHVFIPVPEEAPNNSQLESELARLQIQLDVYKNLYQELLESLMRGR